MASVNQWGATDVESDPGPSQWRSPARGTHITVGRAFGPRDSDASRAHSARSSGDRCCRLRRVPHTTGPRLRASAQGRPRESRCADPGPGRQLPRGPGARPDVCPTRRVGRTLRPTSEVVRATRRARRDPSPDLEKCARDACVERGPAPARDLVLTEAAAAHPRRTGRPPRGGDSPTSRTRRCRARGTRRSVPPPARGSRPAPSPPRRGPARSRPTGWG